MTQVAKVPPSNGTKTNGAEVVKMTTPVIQPPAVIKKADDQAQPLDERLHRLNQLFEIQSKYNRLLASKQKLNEFKLVQKTENITLSIEDNNKRDVDFETKNPEVIAEVLECVRQAIDARIKAIEPLLKW